MMLFHVHFKKDNSNMWCCWVRHRGFGLKPRLRTNFEENTLHFYFLFTWWKLEWYRVFSTWEKKGGQQ